MEQLQNTQFETYMKKVQTSDCAAEMKRCARQLLGSEDKRAPRCSPLTALAHRSGCGVLLLLQVDGEGPAGLGLRSARSGAAGRGGTHSAAVVLVGRR